MSRRRAWQICGASEYRQRSLGDTRIPQRVDQYDETVTSERIIAVGDLYYIYQHEKIGVFCVMQVSGELSVESPLQRHQLSLTIALLVQATHAQQLVHDASGGHKERIGTGGMSRLHPHVIARGNCKGTLSQLKEFVSIPSISSQPKHASDLKRCAEWLANHLRLIGLENVRIVKTPRHPIVYADWLHAEGRPTVLIYGHYDVQPVDPLSEWQSPPFEPVVRGNNLYGRGASDDKGQLFTHVKAIESYLRTVGRLPVNVKCLFEGEEEIGSPNLRSFLLRNEQALAADVAVMSDTRMLAPDRPAITYALRGALSLELEVTGPPQDLHSGNYGGAVHNPLQVLCEIIASLHDPKGRIRVQGFYDRVRHWSEREREYMAEHGPSDASILHDAGVRRGWGEGGYSLYEQTTIRPTLTITGIGGGHQGPGGKSIIPARANAKISIRLVPDQIPREIEQLFRRHIARRTPATVSSTVRTHFSTSPALVSRTHPAMTAAVDACRKTFGTAPVFLRSGGSIPVVNSFQTLLGMPTILMGFGLPDDRIHAPNEKFHLPNLYRGIETCARFLSEMAQVVLINETNPALIA